MSTADKFPMEGSDDFPDDIWSPALHETLFSDHNFDPTLDNNANDIHPPGVPPLFHSIALHRPTGSTAQQQRGINTHASTHPRINMQNPAPQLRKSRLLPTQSLNDPSGFYDRQTPPSSTRTVNTTLDPNNELVIPPSPTSTYDSDSSASESTASESSSTDSPRSDIFAQHSDILSQHSDHDHSDQFVDLTGSTPPMSPGRNSRPGQRRTLGNTQSLSSASPETPLNPTKRRKIGHKSSQSSKRSQEIEGIDLTGVDDDKGLSNLLEQQRMATVKAQQEQANKPLTLSSLQCIICMENMKDMTTTSCGHLFCYSCLMEALIAGENQGAEPGKGISKCPVCRKKVTRPLPTDRKDKHDLVPLTIKLKVGSRAGKGKRRAM